MKPFIIRNLGIYIITSILISIITGVVFSENSYPILETILGISFYVFPFIFVFGAIPHLIYELLGRKKTGVYLRLIIKTAIYATSLLIFLIITGGSISLICISLFSALIYFILDEFTLGNEKKAY